MQKKLNKIAKDTNVFLKRFIKKQKKSELIVPMQYGLFSGGKKIRSKILVDIGSIFNFCLLYTSPSPRDRYISRMPSSA